jgi:hypothetical protein
MSTLRRLLALAGMPARRVGLSVLLGALAVGFGIALMATAGYLISRAAEHPPILSLTVTIVLVRFFGLARPIARYLVRSPGFAPASTPASSRWPPPSSAHSAAGISSPAWSGMLTLSRVSTSAASGRRSSLS